MTTRAGTSSESVIPDILRQHLEEAAFLHMTRSSLVKRAGILLRDVRSLDDRLVAHLDGMAVGGEDAWTICDEELETGAVGVVFAVGVRALEDGDITRLEQLITLAETSLMARPGLLAAFGWVDPKRLQGIVLNLMTSDRPFKRHVGIAACAMHRVNPDVLSKDKVHDSDSAVRARVLRTVGEIGCVESLAECRRSSEDPECRFWAAWSSVLLGDRGSALDTVADASLRDGRHQPRAFRLALQAMTVGAAHDWLRQRLSARNEHRWLIRGSGIVGDPAYVPWLIKHMTDNEKARLAGEAFALITGADFDILKLERQRPTNFESGPNDDPEDPNVDLDEDEGLPWPDPNKIQRWWAANEGRFQKGTRYFIGAPVTREHCIDVLKNGYQRQRILAAHYLCLLEPGTPLFNTSAPAWRQQRLLAKMI